jgi:hypothetical protein
MLTAVSLLFTARGGTQPPAVHAGEDLRLDLGQPALLDDTVTLNSRNSSSLTTEWRNMSGLGDVTFADTSAIDTTATFSEPGAYGLALEASDGELTAIDEVTINVTDVPPTSENLISKRNPGRCLGQ